MTRVTDPIVEPSDMEHVENVDGAGLKALSLRPQILSEFIGQAKIRDRLELFVRAARQRGDALDHVLLAGPPGLGKTTLAHIVAHEMGSRLHSVAGPTIEKKGDLAAVLTGLEAQDVLFIDEIHRLPRAIEEVLYSAMEDFRLDLIVGQGTGAKTITIDLPKFTLVGATTRTGLLTGPLRDRFGVLLRIDFYPEGELRQIVERSATKLGVSISNDGAFEIAKRARGTPRVANRLLRRVRDCAQVEQTSGTPKIDRAIADSALEMLEIDGRGLDSLDRKFLLTLIEKFDGGPAGIETLAAAIGEERETLEDVVEPFLVQQGFLQRTPRGRLATRLAFEHFGRAWEEKDNAPTPPLSSVVFPQQPDV